MARLERGVRPRILSHIHPFLSGTKDADARCKAPLREGTLDYRRNEDFVRLLLMIRGCFDDVWLCTVSTGISDGCFFIRFRILSTSGNHWKVNDAEVSE